MIGPRLPLERSPAHANPRSLGLRRPVAVRALSRHPARARPRRARGVADRQARAGIRSTRWPRRCRAWPSTAARIASPADSCGACARTKAPGSATCSSTSPSSCRTSPARKSRSARRAARASPASTPSSTNTRSATKASRPATSRCGCSARCCRETLRPAGSVPEGWSWPEARDDFIRFAQTPRARPVDRVAGARGGRARHPVAAPQRSIARAARSRQIPAAHPGDGLRAHAAHRGGAGERQGRDEQDPRIARPAGAAAGARAERRRRQCAPRTASAFRSSPSRTTAITAAAFRFA